MITAINHTDLLYVTALSGGVALLSTSISGVSSIGDVFRQIRRMASAFKGVVTLKIRNSTQGWAQQHTIVMKPTATAAAVRNAGTGHMADYPSLFPEI